MRRVKIAREAKAAKRPSKVRAKSSVEKRSVGSIAPNLRSVPRVFPAYKKLLGARK
jgi:hypothetical protein